ncbi:hypothetical protein [Demequina salsinemoris]|uniref:primosomal protein N' family DNA-binding protein n=1 Tax=Demequina salsinemoris TaxID=577470 RepID=UPI000780232A|nr:hypothetical protein [Demequina salsinemoris]
MGEDTTGGKQPDLLAGLMPAARIARIVIDSPLPHLDAPFDYLIPDKLARVEVGFRVRVPFAGRLVSGVVMEIVGESDFAGKLLSVSTAAYAPSYTPASLRLAETLARRACGSTWDVLRLMAPPRVAAVEKREPDTEVDLARLRAAARELGRATVDDTSGDADTRDADTRDADTRDAVTRDDAPARPRRIVRQCLPDPEAPGGVPARELAGDAVAAAAAGRGSAIVVLPDARAVAAVVGALRAAGLERWTRQGGGDFTVLDADDGPTVRYGQYLAALRGEVALVIGTRPVAMQPVPALAHLTVWDDAHTAYEDPHAPYLHARTVANVRAESLGCDLLVAGYVPSIEAIALTEHGWATLESPDTEALRSGTPTIDLWDDSRRAQEGPAGRHWMPPGVWRRVVAALESGPVAVVVPRAGYVQATACARCDTWAECRDCGGSLSLPAPGGDPVCTACGRTQADWHCPECNGPRLAQRRQGVARVAEQLRAMAGGVAVTVSSAAEGIVADGAVGDGIVVAVPGAIPAVAVGYAHVVVVDAAVMATGLGGEVTALRHWLVAAAHARARTEGGGVSIIGELPPLTVRALRSWRAAEAVREAYDERVELGLPPVTRHLRIEGPEQAVRDAVRACDAETLGAVVAPDPHGTSLLLTRGAAQACVDALRDVLRAQSKAGGDALRVRVDGPLRLL